MDQQLFIHSIIQKLGHSNCEVRERALDNIINKLKHGIVTTLELSSNRSLLTKLLQWFNQPVVNKKQECLQVILDLAKHEHAASILYQLGAQEFLQALKQNLNSHEQALADDILEMIYIVPDTQTNADDDLQNYNPPSSIEAAAPEEHSGERSDVPRKSFDTRTKSSPIVRPLVKSYNSQRENHITPQQWIKDKVTPASKPPTGPGFIFLEFPWICLTPTDIHVMESTNQSLVSQDAQQIISACDFLVDVILYDFPAEIFLQRPLIIKTLSNLLNNLATQSGQSCTEIGLALVNAFIKLARAVKTRMNFHCDAAAFAPKQDLLGTDSNPTEESSIRMSSSSESHCSRPSVIGISDGKDDNATDEDDSTSITTDDQVSEASRRSVSIQITTPNMTEIELQDLQLMVPEFCLMLHKSAMLLLERCDFRLSLELNKLLVELQMILKSCLTPNIWDEPSSYAKDLCEKLRLQLHNTARIANKFYNQTTEEQRLLYITLALHSVDTYKTFIPVDKAADLLGSCEKQLLYAVCFDESLAQCLSAVRTDAAEYLKVCDAAGYNVYEDAMNVCASMKSYTSFLLDYIPATKDEPTVVTLAAQADSAILSIPYHMNKEIIPAYVTFCADVWPLVQDDQARRDILISILLKYLSHPISSIRKECYISVVGIMKASLSFDKPTQSTAMRLKFILNHSLLWEVACFGLSSDIPEIIKCSQDIFNYIMQCRMLVSSKLWSEICSTLLPILPLIQSYATPDTTLGKCVLAMLDPHFDSNISKLHCVKGCLRILFCRDIEARTQAAKILFTALNENYSSYVLYPFADVKKYQGELVQVSQTIREMNVESRSVFTSDSLTRVLRVFLADDVQQTVRLASLDQLCVMLQNPAIHKYYLEQNGLQLTMTMLKDGVCPTKAERDEQMLSGAVTILAFLLQYNPDIRQSLAADMKALLLLLRCCWLHIADSKTGVEACQCLAYIIFDEASPQNSNCGSLFTLPKTCCLRYKLPLRVLSYCDISAHRVDVPPGVDPLMQTQPGEMLRMFWNVTWHGKVDDLLASFESEVYSCGSDRLILSSQDVSKLKSSSLDYLIFDSLKSIGSATNHAVVAKETGSLCAYAVISKFADSHQALATVSWKTYFGRFLQVFPVAPIDKELLLRVTGLFVTLMELRMPSVTENLIKQLESVLCVRDCKLLSLVHDASYSTSDAAFRQPLQTNLLVIMKTLGVYSLKSQESTTMLSGCGNVIKSILKRLTMADASNFYNLASLESSVATLLQLTSRPGWSFGCSDTDSRSLCFQLLKALFEVLSAFHLGRQGNDMSYMGKGVLKSATLCLRHVCVEITSVVKERNWVQQWLDDEKIADFRPFWLMNLWTYRDQEVRAAALGVSVALISTGQAGLAVFHPLLETWAAAVAISLDATDCCLARQQAATLMSNLVIQVHLQRDDPAYKAVLSNMLGILENADFFNELCSMLTHDIYVDAVLDLAGLQSHIQDSDSASVSTTVYPTIATPRLLSSVIQCMIAFSSVLPVPMMSDIHQAGLLAHIFGVFSNTSVHRCLQSTELSTASVTLRNDVIDMCTQLLSLARVCSVADLHLCKKVMHCSNGFSHVFTLLAELSIDESIALHSELHSLLAAQLYQCGNTILDQLIPVLNKHWSYLIESSVRLLESKNELERASVLEFWTVACLRMLERQENVSEATETIQIDDNDDMSAFGSQLCQKVLPLYDALLVRFDDSECAQERLLILNFLKSLLAISETARKAALSAGLVESLIAHMNHFHRKLSALPTQKLNTAASSYIAQLISALEIMSNMMHGCSAEVKVILSEAGIASLLHRLWVWCESDTQLMDTVLCTLTTYTSNSVLACRHLVCTSAISGLDASDADRLQTTPNSLAHVIVKMFINQSTRMHPDMSLLQRLGYLMCNFSLAPDTLTLICKSTIHQAFTTSTACKTRKVKTQLAVTKMWLQLFFNLSFSAEGQKILLSITDLMSILQENALQNTPDSQLREHSLVILYNLTVKSRSRLLANDVVAQTALSVLQNPDCSAADSEMASNILHSLIYDSMKGKALLKKLGALEFLVELVSAYKQRETTKVDMSATTQNIKRIILAMRE